MDENLICDNYIAKLCDDIEVSVEFEGDLQHVLVNGFDHTKDLRTEKISALTSKISAYACLREKVLELQRDFARKNNLVMEGRDIGSVILPNADFKFFCTADEDVRAQRRFDQQTAMGNKVDFDLILKELRQRDFNDVNREHGALKKMPDSIVLDTTRQTLDQSVEDCLKIVYEKFPELKN